ncbi:NinB/ Orf homologous recombination mediator [Vibrio phage D478]
MIMAKEFVLIKVNNGFAYATDSDREAAASWKIGQAIKINATQQSARSLAYHQRYWAGLIALTFEYWEPDQGMTTEAERKLIARFCKVLDDNGGGGEVAHWGDQFLATLSQNRAQKIQAPNKTKEALHDWIKEQAGYFDVEITPTGPRRKLKSINFNAMSEEQFRDYYKAAFNVCWRYVLAKPFNDEVKAHNAISQLLSVG